MQERIETLSVCAKIRSQPQFEDQLRRDLNYEPYNEATLLLIEDLIRFLMRDSTEVRLYLGHSPQESGRRRFLHAKAYLLYSSQRGEQALMFDRINPIAAVVGSSNFTGPGLTTNRELNTVHKATLDPEDITDDLASAEVQWQFDTRAHPNVNEENRRMIKSEVGARAILDLVQWYESQWTLAEDFKPTLIDLLNESKFGQYEYTPYEVYMKALYEYFKDDLGGEVPAGIRTAVELAEFQEDAVRKARRILAQYDGVMIADTVGMGKTWIGKRLLEDYAYHLRQRALVICPASLRSMWEAELHSATIAAQVLSQEELGRKEFDPAPHSDVDVVLIDEAHNFRTRFAQRYQSLERLLSANGRRGRDGARKKVILLTATPINNNVLDLYNQINLFTGGDRSYFAAAGIGDLHRYFMAARRASREYEATIELFNLLEEVVIRRTRPFIRRTYPEATINGEKVRWPERQLKTINYDLEGAYVGIYEKVVALIDGLNLAHYSLEEYKRDAARAPLWEMELGRQQALVGIFKSLVHMCGKLKAFLTDLAEAGFDGIADISPEPTGNLTLDEAAVCLPGKIVVGGIDATTFIDTDLSRFESNMARLIERIKPYPGVLLGSADTVPRGTSLETFRLIQHLVSTVGSYCDGVAETYQPGAFAASLAETGQHIQPEPEPSAVAADGTINMHLVLQELTCRLDGKRPDVSGVIKFVVTDDTTYRLFINEGKCRIEISDGDADASMTTASKHLLALLIGKLNPMAAFMTRKIKFDGNLQLLGVLSSAAD